MEEQMALLCSADNKEAYQALCTLLDLAKESDQEMAYWAQFCRMLDHPNSYVRIRGLLLLAANVKWDKEGKLDNILDGYLAHVQDEKPIVARKCMEGLRKIVAARKELAPEIQKALVQADFSGYKDSMRPLLEKDREQLLAKC